MTKMPRRAYSYSAKGSLRSRLHSTHPGGLRSRLLVLTQEESAPECFVEELVDKGVEKSIVMQCKKAPSAPDHIVLTSEGSALDYSYLPRRAPLQIAL